MQRRLTLIVLVLSLLLLCACTNQPSNQHNKMSIVTTIFPAYDFARNVAGELADISMLISPGNEVHSFEPTPKDMISIQSCDLLICTGGESDQWVRSMLSADEYKKVNVLYMLDCVTTMDEEHIEGMDVEGDEAEAEAEVDEHVWTSPKNAVQICEAIRDKLSGLDKANAEKYSAACSLYTAKLKALDTEFKAFFEQSEAKTLVFADRFPFAYFTKEYGLNPYAAFPGCSSKTEPSSKTIVFLIDKVKAEQIPAVFCIEFSNGKLADTICGETGAKKFYLHSCHNVSKQDFERGKGYLELMQGNLETLREAFS